MELRQLEYFVAVAEEGSFTRAAARVHVAQPGVSAQVRRLERELGQPLLDRSGHTVRLTAVGAAVIGYARAALQAVEGTRSAVAELTGLDRGHVGIGMVASVTAVSLPGLLAGFHAVRPAVEITLTEGSSDRLLDDLRARHLDVAFVGLAAAPPPGIDTHVVADEPLVAVVSVDDALAARTRIDLAALAGRALICLPRGTGLRALTDQAHAAEGLEPRIGFEASDPHILAGLAVRGLGVAILPESVAAAHAGEVRAIAIDRPRLRARIALAWRTEGPMSPAARAFVEHVRATVTPRRENVT
jgi:DNA-binding transcriptional LysR family regulator